MALKTKLGKAEHDALDESLKSLYIPDGEGFKLDADFEDVEGLKAKRDEFRTKYEQARDLAKQFEGLDPEKAKEALAKLSEIEDGQLLKKQQIDDLFAKKKSEWDSERERLAKELDGLVARQAERDLTFKLMANGIREDRAEDLAIVLTNKHIKHVKDGNEVVWKSMDGLETVDLDKFIPELKNSKADYFKSQTQTGGNALGSGNNGGNAKTMPKSQWDTLDPIAQAAAIKDGVKPVD
jgi:hypothetical protein